MTTKVGVGIGLAKSISSRNRLVLEFAKKYWVDGKRAFMVPIRDILVSQLTTQVMGEFMFKHNYSLNDYLRLRGFGFRTRSKVGANFWNIGSRLRVILVMSQTSRHFLDWISMKSLKTNFPMNRTAAIAVGRELIKEFNHNLQRLEKERVQKGGNLFI